MPAFIASILRRITGGKPASAPAPASAAVAARDESRLRERTLIDALDRAMDMGLWEHAGRVARTALRVHPRSARLTERLARLAMLEGAPERALQLIDNIAPAGPSDTALRLLRAGCLVQLGRRDRAHADLLRWSILPTAPLEARVMLALLEWDGDDLHAATQLLLRNLRRTDDPRTLEVLSLIAVAQARTARAREWADRLVRASAFGAGSGYTRLLLCSLQLPPAGAAVTPTAAQVDQLARELRAAEDVIPSLVEAQRIRPDADVANLLEQALARALPELARPAACLEALTRLAMIRGERAAARTWAERGLVANPLSAPLSIMYRALADDEARERDRAAASPDGSPTAGPDVLATIGRDERGTERGKAA